MKLRVQPPEGEASAEKSEDVTQEGEDPEVHEPAEQLPDVSEGTQSEEPAQSHPQVQPPETSTQPVPMREGFVPPGGRPLQGERSFVSSANESFITGPATLEGSSDTTGRTPDSYDTMRFGRRDHGAGPTGGGWSPA